MAENMWNRGDLVQLKCGGPQMVVESMKFDGLNYHVSAWYVTGSGEVRSISVHPDLLLTSCVPPEKSAPRSKALWVAAVIKNSEGRYLLRRRGPGTDEGEYGPPGGHVEYGESPDDAVMREVLEETDCEVAALSLVGWYDCRSGLSLMYRVVIAGEPRHVEEKHGPWEWCEPREDAQGGMLAYWGMRPGFATLTRGKCPCEEKKQ